MPRFLNCTPRCFWARNKKADVFRFNKAALVLPEAVSEVAQRACKMCGVGQCRFRDSTYTLRAPEKKTTLTFRNKLTATLESTHDTVSLFAHTLVQTKTKQKKKQFTCKIVLGPQVGKGFKSIRSLPQSPAGLNHQTYRGAPQYVLNSPRMWLGNSKFSVARIAFKGVPDAFLRNCSRFIYGRPCTVITAEPLANCQLQTN